MDACLSSIIERDLPATVLNVPSVHQWEAYELDAFCKHLSRKTVVIVVDSDADGNDAVMTEGILLRERLREHRLRACLAAPPPDRRTGAERLEKVGLDDHLGLFRRSLDDIEVIRYELPENAVTDWKTRYALTVDRRRRDGIVRDARTLEGLIRLCGPNGQTPASIRKIARFIGGPTKAADVKRAVTSLIEAGVVEKSGTWVRRTRRGVWLPPPRIIIKDTSLWARALRMRLADWLAHSPTEDIESMQDVIERNDRNLAMAYHYLDTGGSLDEVAEHFKVTKHRVRQIPEVRQFMALRRVALDLFIFLMSDCYGHNAPAIAKRLTANGEKISANTVRTILAQRMQHGFVEAWKELLANDEFRSLVDAAFEQHDMTAAARLSRLLWANLRPFVSVARYTRDDEASALPEPLLAA